MELDRDISIKDSRALDATAASTLVGTAVAM